MKICQNTRIYANISVQIRSLVVFNFSLINLGRQNQDKKCHTLEQIGNCNFNSETNDEEEVKSIGFLINFQGFKIRILRSEINLFFKQLKSTHDERATRF